MIITMNGLPKVLIANIKADIPTMIWGPPGVGKSQGVYQTAEMIDMDMFEFRATLHDTTDLIGIPFPDFEKGVTRYLPPSTLPGMLKRTASRKVLFFMDELPQTGDAMQKACFSLVLDRRVAEYKLPEGCVPVAAGNRMIDRSGVSRMNKALANRFAHIEVAPDLNSWVEWATAEGLDPGTIAFMRFRPALLHKIPDNDDNAFPSPRSWEAVSRVMADPETRMDETLRRVRVSACVGDAAATDYDAFLRIAGRAPSVDDIFANPKTCMVPDEQEIALRFCIASAIGHHVERNTMASAIIYLNRLGKELEVMAITHAIKRDKELKETRAFAKWYSENQDVLI